MLQRIIEASVRNRLLVVVAALLMGLGGVYAMLRTPVDAIPDLSDVQVIVVTDYAGQAPQVIEDHVTYPLATALLSVPTAKTVRGYSFFGQSYVYVLFEDGTDTYWARNRVLEHLSTIAADLPPGATPELGPDATGVGWVYEYVLDGGDQYDLQQLRSIQDWLLRYELLSVPGVAEVASIGGFVKEYQVEVDPNKLLAYNLSISDVTRALRQSNRDAGAGLMELGESEFMVRGLGYFESMEDIRDVVLAVDDRGTPILVAHVAQVSAGPALRRGLGDWNGEGEVVGGIVVMRNGANTLTTIEAVKERLAELESTLPPGVTVRAAYDRSGLILRAIDNLRRKLIEESLIVALVVLLFLFHVRSALVVILSLPLGLLMAFLAMHVQGLSANIMSLSGFAIAIGAMVDGAIVMVENAHKHLERDAGRRTHWAIIADSAKEVGPPLFYSLLIITLSFLPVFTLQAQEGRLFAPLAYTKTYAMAASALLTLTLVPILTGYLARGKILPEARNPVNRWLIGMYRPLLPGILRYRWPILAGAVLLLAATAYPLSRLGSEFMPPLDEGDLLYMPTTDPGISISTAKDLLQQTDRIIAQFPEVEYVKGKVGRAESATDPAPLSMIESVVKLRPKSEWREGMTRDRLVAEMDAAVQFPGLTNAWTMPIRGRIDMLTTGVKTPVGIKVLGQDLAVLEALGQQITDILREVPGTASAFAEKTGGANYLDFSVRRAAAARFGLTVQDVHDVIVMSVGGTVATTAVEGSERYAVRVRYQRDLRENLDALQQLLIRTPSGAQVPLHLVADLKHVKGPPVIKSENARRAAWVYVDVRGVDIGTYVASARAAVEQSLDLPAGYGLAWTGQYEYMQRAQDRLRLVVPLTIIIILVLLLLNFGRITECLIVMLSIPFSLVGGIWILYAMGYHLSVAVGVGLLALAGLAAELGVLLLSFLNRTYRDARAQGHLRTAQDLKEVIYAGLARRLRPILMTVFTVALGLLPILWGTGTGSQVMKRVAAPIVGGVVSTMVLCLVVLPIVYYLWKRRSLPPDPAQG